MTFDELKAAVIETADETRQTFRERDGKEYTDTEVVKMRLYASVGACRIVRDDENEGKVTYIWTIDPDPRREADERLWAEMEKHLGQTGFPHMLAVAITTHQKAIQAINAGKSPA
jgi:DNA polymerase IIIc chi subunit